MLGRDLRGIHMRGLITVAAAVIMASLFSVMFWSQVGAVATAVAQPKPQGLLLKSTPYLPHLPLQMLDPVY
jgi:hypothetical protein